MLSLLAHQPSLNISSHTFTVKVISTTTLTPSFPPFLAQRITQFSLSTCKQSVCLASNCVVSSETRWAQEEWRSGGVEVWWGLNY